MSMADGAVAGKVDGRVSGSGFSRQRVFQVVRAIPIGFVSTYGDIARMAGNANGAMAVGAFMRDLDLRDAVERTVPWWRVVNGQGKLHAGSLKSEQRDILLEEGIRFRPGTDVVCHFRVIRWNPTRDPAFN